ncbi:MAG: S8 family serine peptidase [Deltaproteobacteria bacterium]|nr:S8 family serine peptidase [Deltaproteobacteria bacterium]
MRHLPSCALAAPLAALLLGAVCACEVGAPAQDPTCTQGQGLVSVVIHLKADDRPVALRASRASLASALTARGLARQANVRDLLQVRGAEHVVPLPVANAIAARVPASMIAELVRRPEVARVSLDLPQRVPEVTYSAPTAPAWNLSSTGAPSLWAMGLTGSGVVVANMDTGVDVKHPDLRGSFRGGANSWFDPYDHTPQPFDTIGHGTQTMGLMVGGNASGAPIGMAPGATWIAARIYDSSGQTTASTVHQAFQWLLDPDGDPSTDDAPNIVNASWGSATIGACDPEFEADLDAMRTAGILVVFSAGNAGPAAGTGLSPSNNPGAFSIGALDSSGSVASFSSRGPSSCTGDVFPDLVAPGVQVLTSDLTLAGVAQYASVTGTSFSAPHVAGAAALLLGAQPTLSPADLENLLLDNARDLGAPGPDQTSGHGALDVAAAYAALVAQPPAPLQLEPRQLPLAHVAAPYHQTFHLVGATASKWEVASGQLPPGMSLDATGVLSGTPTAPGQFPFTLRVESAAQAPFIATATLAVLEDAAPSVSHCSP